MHVCVCMCMCAFVNVCSHEGQKRVSDVLHIYISAFSFEVVWHVVVGPKLVFTIEEQEPLTSELSLLPLPSGCSDDWHEPPCLGLNPGLCGMGFTCPPTQRLCLLSLSTLKLPPPSL